MAVSCSNLNHLHVTLRENHVIPNQQLPATGNTSSALEIGCYIHYCDIQRFLNFKWNDKYVQMSLIFILLISLCGSLSIHLNALPYLFWCFYLQGALHLKIIGCFILYFCYILPPFKYIFAFSNMPLSQVSFNIYWSQFLLK